MFILHDKKMNEIILPKGVIPLDIFISSINRERITEQAEGSAGNINYGSTYNTRDIELKLLLKANDTQDYRLLRNAVYATFLKEDSFFVSEKHEKGKRYLISVDEQFVPERIPNTQRYAEATISCTKLGTPFAESIGTTLDIDKNGINSDDELWGFGMGLQSIDETLNYTHTGNTFSIYNAGNVGIHPFEDYFNLTLDNIYTSTYTELTNLTNNTSFRINDKVAFSDVVTINGANVEINGLNALRRTNKKFISLEAGWNHFVLKGATSIRAIFDFRFKYY